MRTPIWETSAGALAALLNSGAPLNKADVYIITLANGTVLRWSGADTQLTFGGNTYILGPGITRSRVRFVVGVEVSTLDLQLIDILGTTINGKALLPFIAARGFNGAQLRLIKVFWGVGDTGPVGALEWFTGSVRDSDIDRYEARLSVKSGTELLDTMVPREVYQPGCLNTLYDSACGLTRAAVNGAATGATDTRRITFSHNLGQAAGWFDRGTLTFISGPNAGVARTVRTHTTGQVTVLSPWPFAVASGHTFSVTPGCDKTLATCTSKFNNRINFRGHPFIPVPETVL
jgi:uncharacterized phage protein (TIGR02218 family)